MDIGRIRNKRGCRSCSRAFEGCAVDDWSLARDCADYLWLGHAGAPFEQKWRTTWRALWCLTLLVAGLAVVPAVISH